MIGSGKSKQSSIWLMFRKFNFLTSLYIRRIYSTASVYLCSLLHSPSALLSVEVGILFSRDHVKFWALLWSNNPNFRSNTAKFECYSTKLVLSIDRLNFIRVPLNSHGPSPRPIGSEHENRNPIVERSNKTLL